MRHVRTLLLLAVPLLCAAPGLGAAQDYETYYERDGEHPWAGPGQVRQAAQQIALRATELARSMRDLEGYSPLAAEAQRFARTARIFERSVRSGAPYDQVLSSFEVLQREYYTMREAFFRAHRTHHVQGVVNAWTTLVANYERLALALGIDESQLCILPEDRYRYGRADRYRRDDRYGRADRYDPYDPRGQYID